MMTLLNLASQIACTEVEGPGRRFALWVQGCTLRCSGCCNPHLFNIVPRTIIDSAKVAADVEEARNRHGIEGVTFLGGEPMIQARGLAEVAHAARRIGLSVMVFTGYRREELDALNLPGTRDLVAATDLLVDGRFVESDPDSVRNWVGSANQRFHFLTDRYAPGIEYDKAFGRAIEIRVARDLRIRMNGWPTRVRRRLRAALSP
jgi:anaerobic ribonucleoside-triphosphate reductase activating protein